MGEGERKEVLVQLSINLYLYMEVREGESLQSSNMKGVVEGGAADKGVESNFVKMILKARE